MNPTPISKLKIQLKNIKHIGMTYRADISGESPYVWTKQYDLFWYHIVVVAPTPEKGYIKRYTGRIEGY